MSKTKKQTETQEKDASKGFSYKKTELYQLWKKRVKTGNPDDLVIAIAPSSRSGVSGVGKTTLAVVLAKTFDVSQEGFNAKNKATLNASKLDKIYRETPNGSALIFDEAQGTMQSQGMDARRSMSQETMEAVRTIALNRNKNCTAIIASQSTRWLDQRMMDLVDALLLIQKKGVAKHYQYFREDLNFKNPQEYTPGLEKITWPKLPETDNDYRHLEKLKEEAKKKQRERKKKEIPKEKKIEIAQNLRDMNESGKIDITTTQIGEVIDMSQSWVVNHTET